MEQPSPDAAGVAGDAAALAKLLNNWASRTHKSQPLDVGPMRGLMGAFARQGAAEAGRLDWDQAAQFYLALGAFNQALNDRTGKAPATAPLQVIRDRLQGAFPSGYDSPRLYDEAKKTEVGRQLRIAQQLLAP
jgi:hypothetical protein